jgi:hypothetical protein
MPTVTLRPNATETAGALTGAASAHAATSDDSDASYVTETEATVGLTVGFGTSALTAGFRTKTVTLRARMIKVSGTGNITATGTVGVREGGVFTETLGAPQSIVPTVIGTGTFAAIATDLSQTDIDNLGVSLTALGESGGSYSYRVHELYLDVDYALLPVCAVTYPTGAPAITDTTAPTFTWTHTPGSGGGPQSRYEVKVFTAAQYGAGGFDEDTSTPFWTSGEVLGAATSKQSGPLDNSTTYRVYVRTAQTINGAAHWSAWDFEGFSIAVATADVAQVIAIADDTNARIVVEVDPDLTDATASRDWEHLELQRSIDTGTTWEYVRGGNLRAVGATAEDVWAVDLPGTSGNYISTPDVGALDITGDITLIAHVALDDWSPASAQALVSKRGGAASQISYDLRIDASGAPAFVYATGGGVTAVPRTATANLSTLAAGAWKWVACTVDVVSGANHDVRFWTSDDGVTWTQLGATVTTAGNIALHSGTANVELGSYGGGASEILAGRVRRAQVRSGIGTSGVVGGTLVADYHANGEASYTDVTGKVWTVNGASSEHVAVDVAVGGVVSDYEVDNGTSVLYRARLRYTEPGGELITGPWISSTATSWESLEVFVKNVADPTVNTTVDMLEKPRWTRPQRRGVFPVIGRQTAVTVSDAVRGKREGTMLVETVTAAQAAALLALVESTDTVLIQWPAEFDIDQMYASLGDVEEAFDSLVSSKVERVWSLSGLVEVDAPVDEDAP